MKCKFLLIILGSFLVLTACESTYKRESMTQSLKELAKREYNHDIETAEEGETVGIRLKIRNLLAELVAEDQQLWTHMEELMMVLSRVVLSSDHPPEFIILDVVDEENPKVRLIFTRYVKDIQKLMGEVISRTSFLDRLLMEFAVGEKRMVFDPYEMDMVRLMMMAADVINEENTVQDRVWLQEVNFPVFLSKVTENTMRRLFREEKKMKKEFLLRKITASFEEGNIPYGQFRILLDLVSIPGSGIKEGFLEKKILPRVSHEVQSLFRSYRFDQIAEIVVIEKNSGLIISTVPK